MELEGIVNGLGAAALVWSVTFVSHCVRYVLLSGLTAGVVAISPHRQHMLLQDVPVGESQKVREFWASIATGAVFGLVVLPVAFAFQLGRTQIYFDIGRFGAWYEPISLLLLLLLHDTYFYWTHRWMHRPAIYRRVHAHHHMSRTPTPWSGFSFHWLESLVQAMFYVIAPLVLPVHFSVLGFFVLVVTLHAAMIHSGHDLFCVRGSHGLRVHARLLSTAVDHDLHHSGARGNFGLYFAFWDRVMGTRVLPATPEERAAA